MAELEQLWEAMRALTKIQKEQDAKILQLEAHRKRQLEPNARLEESMEVMMLYLAEFSTLFDMNDLPDKYGTI